AADAGLHLVTLRLQLAQAAEVREDFLLGLVADGAGVEEDEVGLRLVVDAAVAAQFEAAAEPLAVEIVHLTAPRFDEEGLAHGRFVIVSEAKDVVMSSV